MDKITLTSLATNEYNRQSYYKALSLLEMQINKGADGYLFGIRALNTNTTLSQYDCILIVDASAGTVTITLPDVRASEQKVIRVKKIDATANAVNVVPTSGTIDGAANKSTTTQYAGFAYTALNGNWYLV